MKTFAELTHTDTHKPLNPNLMKAIADLKYETPSAIQAQALPILLGEPTDFIGLAATGTGKTAAFGIPMLERIDTSSKTLQAMILCPTRELALQVCGQINLLGKYLKVKALAVYGGTGFDEQLRGLREGVHIVVGTPGRLIDHLERKTLKLGHLKTFILDEADEMISMGFKEDLETLLEASPRESSNVWLFSATMSPEVRRVADTYLRKPKHVQINKKEMLSTTVEQLYYPVRETNKPEVLCKLIDAADNFFGIVFCQTKALVIDLTRYMTDRGYKVDCLHGDKDQKSRERTMQAFRDRKVSILICTDVASRGLDVKDVTHVINYSIPRELDSYVHRIGRTARSGKSGFAMSLVTQSNMSLIPRIEKMTNSRMKEGKLPTRRDIGEKKIREVLAKFKDQKSTARAIDLLGDEWKAEIAPMTKEEVVARFLVMSFPEIFENNDTSKHHALIGDEPQREARREGRGHRDSRGGGYSRGDRSSHSDRADRADRGGYRGDRSREGRGESRSFAKPYAKTFERKDFKRESSSESFDMKKRPPRRSVGGKAFPPRPSSGPSKSFFSNTHKRRD